jgi:tetratricopeptide (TPR) repeat protein
MSVLIEAFNVVIRREAIERKYPGGLQQFGQHSPNNTYCCDDHLVRIGFMVYKDATAFAAGLMQDYGVEEQELAIVDQFRGPLTPRDWLKCAQHNDGWSLCWLPGTDPTQLCAPGWWSPEAARGRLNFVPPNEVENYEFIRHEDGVDVYRDKTTGELQYVGRPDVKTDTASGNKSDDYLKKGVELVNPYIILVDVPPESPFTAKGQRDITQGIEYLQQAIQLHTDNWRAYWYLGKTYQAIQDSEQAYQNFKLAYEANPNEADICRELMKECLA